MKLNQLKRVTATVKRPMDKKEIEGRVIMALTQYDLFTDFVERCEEFGIEPFMNFTEYVEFFNEFWACPEGYDEAYDACVVWNYCKFKNI